MRHEYYDALGSYSEANSDGSITTYNDDGSITTVNPDGSSTTIPAPTSATDQAAGAAAAAAAAAAASAPAAAAPASGSWLTSILGAFTSTAQAVAQTAQAVAPAIVSTAQVAVPAALSITAQNRLAAINATRAAQGLPPLTAAQYQAQYVPTPGVNVGLTPATTTTLLWIAGGVGVVALLAVLAKKG